MCAKRIEVGKKKTGVGSSGKPVSKPARPAKSHFRMLVPRLFYSFLPFSSHGRRVLFTLRLTILVTLLGTCITMTSK